jgi:hypothetical protein
VIICSDYDSRLLDLTSMYARFDENDIYFGDKNAEITEIIPLRIFSLDQKIEINNRYDGKFHPSMTNKSIPDGPDFYYAKVEIDNGYFSVLFTNIENTVILNEIIIKWALKLKYFCAVTDGCRRGGAWLCMNEIDNEMFFKKLISSPYHPDYWITDHFRTMESMTEIIPDNFQEKITIKNWGWYNENKETKIYKIK